MSSIPYPLNVDQNLDEEQDERRYALAVKMIDPGDVIAEVESLVAQIIDPKHHPWNLEALAAAYDRLVQEALSKLIGEKLADFGAWED